MAGKLRFQMAANTGRGSRGSCPGPAQLVRARLDCDSVGLVALRAPWLIHQLVRPPLAHALLAGMIYRTAPSFRAQKFPEAMSFSTSLSRLSSATNRFSLAFSCSNSFSRRA